METKEELLAKARKDYPIGTIFKRAHTKDKDKPDIISTGKFEFEGNSWGYIRMIDDKGDFLDDAEGFSAVCYYSEYGWAEIVSKPETSLKVKYLVEGEIYTCNDKEDLIIFKCEYSGNTHGTGFRLSEDQGYYVTDNLFSVNKSSIKSSNKEEKDWLNACIAANKFVPKDEALKTIDSSEQNNFKLPEKWCLKLSSKEINIAVNSIPLWSSGKLYWKDCSTYKNSYIGNDGEYYSKIPINFTEITFEQFKKYVLKKEAKFEVGKWYKVQIICKYDYFKYSNREKVNATNSYERIYFSEYISYEKYTPVKDYIANFEIQNSCVEAALSEIQHYLPEGHPDKIKTEWWKTLKKGDVVRCIANSRNIDTRKVGKEYTLTADCGVANNMEIRYAENAGSKYYAEFELVRRFGELPKIEKWSVGTYVVFLAKINEKQGYNRKVGNISEIISKPSPRIVQFNDYIRLDYACTSEEEGYIKWFATKEEASEFAKTLIGNKYPEYYKFVGIDKGTSFTAGNIYKCINTMYLEADCNFIDDKGSRNGFGGSNYRKFTPATEEEFCAQQVAKIPVYTYDIKGGTLSSDTINYTQEPNDFQQAGHVGDWLELQKSWSGLTPKNHLASFFSKEEVKEESIVPEFKVVKQYKNYFTKTELD